ncbi:alpha/beta hydrolase family protein [Pseudomonas sp. ABC1]|uniref:DUF3530 family protein n=1 Tax=Pseudomonas sp. ABC1 TaxID=2748080 RepID=UPI0015C3F5E8|nr:DUF3530 family protein [Pseudomonas sp. ABC1]QLF92851.1 alpha/beta hydrolase family protein [Pseudomonas sp. ABC1]
MPAVHLIPALLGLALVTGNLPAAFAEEEPATAEQPATPAKAVPHQTAGERSERDAKTLELQFPKQFRQLQADNEAFAGFWLPANTAKPKGVVILLPSDGEHADWPNAVAPLRQNLPDAGWHTLSLTLPDAPDFEAARTSLPAEKDNKQESPAPADDEQTGTGDESSPATSEAGYLPEETAPPVKEDAPLPDASVAKATQTPKESRQERIDKRIATAIAFAKEQKAEHLVLLGHGTGAYWAALYLGTADTPGVDYLLAIATRQPVDADAEVSIPALQLPTADIYYKDDAIASQAAVARRNESRRLDHANYTQIALMQLTADPDAAQERLYRRVRGWLEKQP